MTNPQIDNTDITQITLPDGREVAYDDMTPDDRMAIDVINAARRRAAELEAELGRVSDTISVAFKFLQISAPVNYEPVRDEELIEDVSIDAEDAPGE